MAENPDPICRNLQRVEQESESCVGVTIQTDFGSNPVAFAVAAVIEGQDIEAESAQTRVMIGSSTIGDVPRIPMKDQNPRGRIVAGHEPADQVNSIDGRRGNSFGIEIQVRAGGRQLAGPRNDRKHQTVLRPGQKPHQASVAEQQADQNGPAHALNCKTHSGWNRSPFLAISSSTGAGAKRAPCSVCSRLSVSTTWPTPRSSMKRSGPPRNGGKPMPKMAPMSPSRALRTTPSA